jgi:hypothetical protein
MKSELDGDGRELSWGDGIHPNDAGRRMMADALQTAWGFGKPLGRAPEGARGESGANGRTRARKGEGG